MFLSSILGHKASTSHIPVGPYLGTEGLIRIISRHAVSIDERRCKFKPALLQQDKRQAKIDHEADDIKEVFFPGNHGDIGGGWLAKGEKAVSESEDSLQLSDLALEWMISELDALPIKHPTDQISWNEHKDIFLKNYHLKVSRAVGAPVHDMLKFGGGVSWTSTFMWHILGISAPAILVEVFADILGRVAPALQTP